MMLARQDYAFTAAGLQRFDDRIRIKFRRIKNRRIFVAVAPFFVRERINGEMEKVVVVHLAPSHLPFRGQRLVCRWRRYREGAQRDSGARSRTARQKSTPGHIQLKLIKTLRQVDTSRK